MNDSNSNDVDRALAAFGAQPMKYRSFEKHPLPAAAHAACPVLEDTAFDPFAPQPVMHALDERSPDVPLPTTSLVEATAANDETVALPPPICALPPARRAESPEAAMAAPPEPARVAAVRPMPAPTPIQAAAQPTFAKVARPMPTRPAMRPLAGLSLPTLGAKFAALDKPRTKARDDNVPIRSLYDMFKLLNGRPDLMRRQPGSSRL